MNQPLTPPPQGEPDPHNLARFVTAQRRDQQTALAELASGCKTSHWMWYIFPQLAGLGRSATARLYAIASLDEARAYLEHEVLGPNLLAATQAAFASGVRDARTLFGTPDDMKFRSSMTLFRAAGPQHPQFQRALDVFFRGAGDEATLHLLAAADADRAGIADTAAADTPGQPR